MKPHEHINGEYSQEESLENDREKLGDVRMKLSHDINPFAREKYEAMETKLIEDIKKRSDYILSK